MIQPDWTDERLTEYIGDLPMWNTEVTIEPLVGGLCNKSFTVTDADKKKYVARIGSDILVHGIVQTAVQSSMKAASNIGVTPKLHYSESSMAVVDFLDGGCLTPKDIAESENIEKIVACLKRLHGGSTSIQGPLTYFWPFQVARHYADVGMEKQSRLKNELPELKRVAGRLEAAVRPYTPVFTHNDVVPQNMMFDGSRNVWLIDWDYGGYGHPLFDIVGVGANADATEQTEEQILKSYYGAVSDELRREFNAFKLSINLREYLWGMVQEVTSELDAESVAASMAELYPDQEQGYEGYTNLNRDRFERNWAQWKSEFDG
ncbi:MAG: phosphotransferase family protein [Gammaproteobacteria bacterium]|nr:phosphotransferase family protein [Gammaproteobacteria bacterium]